MGLSLALLTACCGLGRKDEKMSDAGVNARNLALSDVSLFSNY